VRIPFPERIPINRVAIFVVVLFAIQRLEGTALYFAFGCAVFILIAAFAFNAAGGLTRASGAYVFFYSVLVVIVGISYKAFLGEPAQSNLLAPRSDIEAYVGSIAAMYAAVIVSRRFSRKTGLLQNILKESRMYRASVGCIAFGVAGGFAIALLGESGTKLQTAFDQLNQLIPLGIIIGVIYEIRRSGGTHSLNLPVVVGGIYMFINGGLIFFSKEAMLLPFLCWLLPACALRLRLSAWQVLAAFLFVFFFFRYLTPYAQYGRNQVPEFAPLGQRIDVSITLTEHLDETRKLYNEAQDEIVGSRGLSAYYNTPQGFWERLQMVSADDKLIEVTDEGKVFGLLPIKLAFINVVPHFIWPNKPGMNVGNVYAHEITGENQGEGDVTTGISFSPTAEAYHLEKWVGVLVLAPLLWCMLFIEFDSLFGDLRATPWGLLALALITHVAPEGGLSNMIYLLSFGVEALVFSAFFATWFAPLLAIPILGPERQRNQRRLSFWPPATPPTPR
jgi:hypothetical protein